MNIPFESNDNKNQNLIDIQCDEWFYSLSDSTRHELIKHMYMIRNLFVDCKNDVANNPTDKNQNNILFEKKDDKNQNNIPFESNDKNYHNTSIEHTSYVKTEFQSGNLQNSNLIINTQVGNLQNSNLIGNTLVGNTLVGNTLVGNTQNIVNETQSSANLGRMGESWVYDLIANEFSVENTTKTGHSGDFHINLGKNLIVVEIKNYTRTVNSGEVRKFQDDLQKTSANCGVFISLNSRIAEIKGDFVITYEMSNGKLIPCAYICLANTVSTVASSNINTSSINTNYQLNNRNRDLSGAMIIKAIYIVNNLHNYFINSLSMISDNDKHKGLVAGLREKIHSSARSRITFFEDIAAVNKILNDAYARYLRDEIEIENIARALNDNVVAYEVCRNDAGAVKQFSDRYFGGALLDVYNSMAVSRLNKDDSLHKTDNKNQSAKSKLCESFVKTYDAILDRYSKYDDMYWKFLKSSAVHTSGISYVFGNSAVNGLVSIKLVMPAAKLPDEFLLRIFKSPCAGIKNGNVEIDITGDDALASQIIGFI